MHGLGCAYDFLDDPAQKALAASLIERAVGYLVAHDWVALQHDGVTMSAPFIQSTDKMVAFTALAAHVSPTFQPRLVNEIEPSVTGPATAITAVEGRCSAGWPAK